MATGKSNIPDAPVSEEDILKYEEEWTKNMATFWREKMQKLGVHDTGALARSIQGMVSPGPTTTIQHNFLLYGIYVAAGVSPAFRWEYWTKAHHRTKSERMNGGYLEILDRTYRKERGLDKPKKVGPAWGGRIAGGKPKGRRDWFFRKYYYSVMRLNEFEAAAYGKAYQGLLATAIQEIFNKVGAARNL